METRDGRSRDLGINSTNVSMETRKGEKSILNFYLNWFFLNPPVTLLRLFERRLCPIDEVLIYCLISLAHASVLNAFRKCISIVSYETH